MKLIDRYVLTQLIGPFGFFTFVFTGVIWLTQSLRQVDAVINSGETAYVFLEFTMLLLPRALVIILPLSAFGAAIYTLNRLYTESELVVMLTVGQSPHALLRPVLWFGLIVAALMYSFTMYILPVSESRLAQRRFELRNELISLFLREGDFVHPSDGVTLFIRSISKKSEMAGIFLNDQRNPSRIVTYSADRALLLRDDDKAQIALIDGNALIYSPETGMLESLDYQQFTYDLSDLLETQSSWHRRPAEYFFYQSLFPTEEMTRGEKRSRGEFISKAHEYISAPLFGIVGPAIALGSILFGGFRRGGFTRRIGMGVGLIFIIQQLVILAYAAVRNYPWLFPVAYFPAILGFSIAFLLIRFSNSAQPARKKKVSPA
ncbi:MAG: LptF/LptG family permease [Paracoccaceae bacterium]